MNANTVMNDYTIRLEEKKDYREVENLVRESFWYNTSMPEAGQAYGLLHRRKQKGEVRGS